MSKARLVGAALLAATMLIAPFEGKRLMAYLDPPGIPTICYGHTGGVSLGQRATDDQCEAWLAEDIAKAEAAFDRLVKIEVEDNVKAAFLSFIYNVGEGKFAKSTALRKLNRGDIVGACNELPRWVYAGGVKLKGLVNRREAERQLCLR